MACGAEVHGAFDGSPDLRFLPGAVAAGDFRFDIGTRGGRDAGPAGGPARPRAPRRGASRVRCAGGTHVPAQPQPPLPVAALGAGRGAARPRASRLQLERAGFFPRGGGGSRPRSARGRARRPSTSSRRGALVAVRGDRGRGAAAGRRGPARGGRGAGAPLGGSAGSRRSGRSSSSNGELARARSSRSRRCSRRAAPPSGCWASGDCARRCSGSGRRGALLRFLEDEEARRRPVARRPARRAAGARRGRRAAADVGGDGSPRDGGGGPAAVRGAAPRPGAPRRAGRPGGGARLTAGERRPRMSPNREERELKPARRCGSCSGTTRGRASRTTWRSCRGPARGAPGAGRLLGRSALAAVTAAGAALAARRRRRGWCAPSCSGEPVHCTWQLSPRCESFCHLCEHRAETPATSSTRQRAPPWRPSSAGAASLLVSFTGSEPFLRGDLAAVVAAAAAWHFPLLVTNGWLVTPGACPGGLGGGPRGGDRGARGRGSPNATTRRRARRARTRARSRARDTGAERTRRSQRVNVRTRLRGADLGPLERVCSGSRRPRGDRHGGGGVPAAALDGDAAACGRAARAEAPAPPPAQRRARLDGLGRALSGGVRGCMAGRAFFNVDHRGRVSKCVEFRGPGDRVGSCPADRRGPVRPRLRARHGRNDCRACWYASRAEVECLYTVRGFLARPARPGARVRRAASSLLARAPGALGAAPVAAAGRRAAGRRGRRPGERPARGPDGRRGGHRGDAPGRGGGGRRAAFPAGRPRRPSSGGTSSPPTCASCSTRSTRRSRPARTSGCSRLRPAARGNGPAGAARARAGGQRRGLLRRAARQAAALRGERGPRLHADEPVILAHELRHALQDQYEELDSFLGDEVRLRRPAPRLDVAPRRRRDPRDGALREAAPRRAGGRLEAPERSGGARAPGLFDVPGAPPVVRDQLVQPYLAGLDFARALWAQGGGRGPPRGLGRPPESTEQVLHPGKFLARERPRRVVPAVAPARRAPGSSPRASSASCSCGRSRRGRRRPRRRAGAGTGGGSGTSGERRPSPGAASGTAPPTRGVPRRPAGGCAAGGRPAERAGSRSSPERAAGASRCAEPETRWSSCPPTTRGCSTRLRRGPVGAKARRWRPARA